MNNINVEITPKFDVGTRVNIISGHRTGFSGTIKEQSKTYNNGIPRFEYRVVLDGERNERVYFEYNLEPEDILDQNVDPMMSEGNYYGEMATIAIGEKLNINVNPETERLSIAYFKVLNAESFRKATKVARLHFKDSGMEYHKDGSGKQPWILNSQELKRLLKLLKSNHTDNDGYTNWQIACYQWNLENGLIKQGMHDYFSGKYDHMYDNDNRLKEAYVPSTQEMPETWIYDPSKGKK